MRAIATICNSGFSGLLDLWYSQLRKLTSMPIFVLCLDEFMPEKRDGMQIIEVDPDGNPFPTDLPDFACAEKLRLFKHLPKAVTSVFFLDLDVLVIRNFWDEKRYFEESLRKLVICPDTFVGYKEKMEDEFRPYDPDFRMKFNADGSYFYFNTGVFFASRSLHGKLFPDFLSIWKDYVNSQKKLPSVFDQNLVNYCLIRYGLEVLPLPLRSNCLRQYGAEVNNGRLVLNGELVDVYHFNGGSSDIKRIRWLELLQKMED